VWGRISRGVDARPRRTWLGAAALLLIMAAGLVGLKADGLGQRDVFTSKVESTTGFDVLEAHFDAGQSSPIRIYVPEADADEAVQAVEGVDGVSSAYLLTESVAKGAPPMGGDEPPIAVDGMVEINAVTEVSSASLGATETVQRVRDVVHPISDQALVGGQAAESLDTRITTDRDITVIIPVIPLIFLAQITVIVGLGVLIDTLIVRSLLVPGLVSDVGRASWWPWQHEIKN